MKDIIFEIIQKLLLSKEIMIQLEPRVIQSMIQNINLFGMSI